MEDKNSKKGFAVFIILIVIAIVMASLAFFTNAFGSKNETRQKMRNQDGNIFVKIFNGKNGNKDDYIAAIHVEGVIQEFGDTYNQEWILGTIDDLKNDPYNRAIILFVDTPGGTVYESDETYLALMSYKKETERPIFAYMAHVAASGGYYISCAADKIFANRNTVTGSIGVINGTSIDATELLQKIGIKPSTFTAGRNKNMRNFDTPITEEQRAIIQAELDEAYAQFTEIVAEGRKMKLEKVREIADGRIYTARQAQANGLVDEIGTWEDTVSAMNDFLGEEFEVFDYEYIYEPSFFEYLYGISTAGKKSKYGASNIEKLAGRIETMLGESAPNIKYPAYIYLGN